MELDFMICIANPDAGGSNRASELLTSDATKMEKGNELRITYFGPQAD
jgi:hypothetical protein